MMNQVTRTEAGFKPAPRSAKVKPVVNGLVEYKAQNRTGKKRNPGRPTEYAGEDDPKNCYRNPRANRKDGIGIAMVDGMKRRCESMESMAEPSVDDVFEKRPGEHARNQHGNALDHACHFNR
jgi:hypothetical protein